MVVELSVILAPSAAPAAISKEGCCICHRTAEHEGGILTSLANGLGVCGKHVTGYSGHTGDNVFMHHTKKRHQIATEADGAAQPTKLAIGAQGGFDAGVSRTEFEDVYSLAVVDTGALNAFPLKQVEAQNPPLYAFVQALSRKEDLWAVQQAAAFAPWAGEERNPTTHTNIEQVPNPPQIGSSGWCCQSADCPITDNLWLNLHDGSVFCGRKQFLSADKLIAGNEHAKQHYNARAQEGRHMPLVLKMGTINPAGADIFSYDEDSFVTVPNLKQLLANFGVDMEKMHATNKTMEQLEIELNMKHVFDSITEAGKELQPLYGPGYTGLDNLGNTCYMSSVLQQLVQVPAVLARFGGVQVRQPDHYLALNSSLVWQFTRLTNDLLSGDFSKPVTPEWPEYLNGLRALAFRELVGRGHAEFSSRAQQDAEEFLRYLLDKLDLENAFKFQVENRLQDVASKRVSYDVTDELVLSVPIDESLCSNVDEVKAYEAQRASGVDNLEPVRPKISMPLLIERVFGEELIADAASPVTGEKTGLCKRIRMRSFPKYLWIQVKRFVMTADYQPRKIDAELQEVHSLDLTKFKGDGPAPSEDLMPETSASAAAPPPVTVDGGKLAEIVSMGFAPELAARALVKYKEDVPQALDCLLSRPDELEQPAVAPAAKKSKEPAVDAGSIETLINFTCCSSQVAEQALRKHKGNVEQAVNAVLTGEDLTAPDGGDDPFAAMTSELVVSSSEAPNYQLVGVVSHTGQNTHCGHYVAHVNKQGQWVIFNDNKVALSQAPPFGYGYLYLYKAADA